MATKAAAAREDDWDADGVCCRLRRLWTPCWSAGVDDRRRVRSDSQPSIDLGCMLMHRPPQRRRRDCIRITRQSRYQTSPALCTPMTPSRPIGRITCAQNFPDSWRTEWSLLLHDVIGDWMMPFAANAAATVAAKIANDFEWPEHCRQP